MHTNKVFPINSIAITITRLTKWTEKCTHIGSVSSLQLINFMRMSSWLLSGSLMPIWQTSYQISIVALIWYSLWRNKFDVSLSYRDTTHYSNCLWSYSWTSQVIVGLIEPQSPYWRMMYMLLEYGLTYVSGYTCSSLVMIIILLPIIVDVVYLCN